MFAATLAGCIHGGTIEYSGPVQVDSAELIAINPDVKVVADAEEPMFFTRGSYWLFHDGGWYRSQSIRSTWVKVNHPPVPVVQIEQPYAYTRFRDGHLNDRTASLEVDNTKISNSRKPDFQFKKNPLAFH